MQRIIGITFTHENQALLCPTNDYCVAFRGMGYDAHFADLATAGGVKILDDALRSGETSFCFGLQGVGSNLDRGGVNLWAQTRVPFIGLHYDHPCYNINNHINASRWVGNIYFAGSFLDIQRRYIGGAQANGQLPFRITAPMADSTIPFKDRPIRLLFLKTGGDLEKFTAYFDGLPPKLLKGVRAIITNATIDPNLMLCDLVRDLLVREGYDPAVYRTQFWAVVQALDYYLRRKRAIDMVEWLKMQDGAVIIGNGWDFIDKTGARAEFRPSMLLDNAVDLYAQTQFVFNTSPYGSDIIHERNISGFMRNCCVISDTNRWWDAHFAEVPSLLRLRMDMPLDAQIMPFLQGDTAECAAAGRAPAMQHFAPQDNYAKIVAFADQIRSFAAQAAA